MRSSLVTVRTSPASATDKLEGLEMLQAYFDILEYWGYPYSCRIAYDIRGDRKVVIVAKASRELTIILRHNERMFHRPPPKKPVWIEYCAHADQLQAITGIPTKFTMKLRGATWDFDSSTGEMLVNKDS